MPDPINIVVDDVRTFDIPHTIHLRTVEEAQDYIYELYDSNLEINTLYLDHDLGPRTDIRPLVRWMWECAARERQPIPIGVIYVISMNPVGSDWIIRQLSSFYKVYKVQPHLLPLVKKEG